MVMPDGEALSDVPGEATEVAPHALPDRLQRLEAVRVPGGMDADAVGRAVVDGDEPRRLTLAGDGRGQIGAPEGVYGLGDDGAVVGPRAAGRADPRGGEEAVLAHQPQHPALRGPNPGMAQPGPDLPVPLAAEGAGGEHGADRLRQRRIRHRPDRAGAPRRHRPRRGAVPIDGGAGGAPDPTDPGQAIRSAAAGRDGLAHGLGLRRAKGPGARASRAAILASSSSRSRSISPSRAFSRSLSNASPSAGREARLASPAARKASRQPLSAAAVTPSERETASRSSPRSSRSTASRLRCRDIRPPRPGPAASIVSVAIVTPPRTASANRVSQPTVGRGTTLLAP